MVLTLAQGCSSGKETTVRTASGGPESSGRISDMNHQAALQKFINGSIYEAKGEFAQAILEYQDALRYETNHAMYFALAKDYSALGKHALAIEAAREAVRLNPDNLDERRLLADVCLAGFEIDSAISQYEEIIRRDSSDLEPWFNLARLYQSRKPLRALEVYDHIIDRFGPEWEVYLQIAELCNKLGKFDQAAEALRQMTDIDPGNQELKRNLAQAYLRAGNADSALAVYSELRSLNPDRVEYIVEIAGVHLAKKEYDRAAKEFEGVLSRDSISVDTKLRIGELYFSQLQKDSSLAPLARSIFERIRDKHPADWRPYWFLGVVGSITHDDSLAVRSFRRVTELASWNADAWVYLSSMFLEKNAFSEVVGILESAARVVPDDFRVNFLLGVAYSRTGQQDDAVRVLQKARRINPKDVDVISQLALVYDGQKRFVESDSLYEEALGLSPDNDQVLNNYGYSLGDRGVHLERALEMAKRAIAAKPDNTSYLDTIGWIYYRLGDYDRAETYIRKAVDKGEASAVVYEHLGDVEYKMNNKSQALEFWNKALQLDEKNTALREKVARGSL
jgi:tetratricopeptide (TPR) repeat protein